MSSRVILIIILTAVAAFAAGFMVANSLNRNALHGVRADGERNTNQTAPANDDPGLTINNEEISAKIAEADRNPSDLQYQKNLGLSLYKYAAMKQDMRLLNEAERLLSRAAGLDPKDRDVLVGLGNARFDIGFFAKDRAAFERARESYSKALVLEPSDVDVRCDLALTYFLQEPPDLDKSVAEFQTGLKSKPDHERSLQFLIQALVRQSKLEDAKRVLADLKQKHPNNQAIPDLTSMVATGSTPVPQ